MWMYQNMVIKSFHKCRSSVWLEGAAGLSDNIYIHINTTVFVFTVKWNLLNDGDCVLRCWPNDYRGI